MSTETDTPESDQWLSGYDDTATVLDAHKTMQKLERERNAAFALLRELVELQDSTGCIWRTSPIMDRIRSLANSTQPQ